MSSLKDLASLIMVPSLYKDGELHTVKPLADENIIVHPDATDNNDGVDGTTTPSTSSNFTFSRGSNLAATRVDVNGLIEKGRENLLLQSNNFGTTWAKSSATIASGQSGYDGSNNAWNFTTSAAGASLEQSVTTAGVVVVSLYAKANGINGVRLRIDAATDANGYFNLSTGAVHSFAGSAINASITSVGGGWYRCEVAANISSPVKVAIYTTDGTTSYDNGSILIQDSQYEQGLVATDYIETTTTSVSAGILEDMPRLDYSGGASCPSLLLEPQRTNAITYSEDFSNILYAKTNASITSGFLSPEGTNNATKLTTSANNGQLIFSSGGGNTNTKVVSVFAKANTSTSKFKIIEQYYSGQQTLFDLNLGVVEFNNSAGSKIENFGNGWFRCTHIQSYTSGQTNSTFAFRTPTAESLFLYGAQLEQGSYPTSYIPTYGTSQTRSNDSCAATSVSDLIGQTQGTLFAQVGDFPEEYNGRIFAISDGTADTYITIIKNGSNKNFAVYVDNGGVAQVSYTGSGTLANNSKIAIGYANNDYAIYVNGTQVHTDTSASVPACDEVYIGQRENGSVTFIAGGSLKQNILFKTRLTNAELAALTTI